MQSNYLLGSPKIWGNPEIGMKHELFLQLMRNINLINNYQRKILKGESEILKYKFYVEISRLQDYLTAP